MARTVCLHPGAYADIRDIARYISRRVSAVASSRWHMYEVTQAEYAKVVGNRTENGRRNPLNNGARFGKDQGGGTDHPMENVEWDQVGEFCKRLSALAEEKKAGRVYRLPTEAEWEYACRAGSDTPFHQGKSLSSKEANFNGNYPHGDAAKAPYLRQTSKVGSYKPNAWGLFSTKVAEEAM